MCGVAQGDACGIGDCCANPLRKAGAARQIAAFGSDYRSDFVFDLDLLLIFKPLREAERRFCAVVLPARMPGEPCWAMDGPSPIVELNACNGYVRGLSVTCAEYIPI